MGNPKAFLTIDRKEGGYRPLHERIYDYSEVEQTLNIEDRKLQASRCVECGVPFCHWACPLANKQPEWQDYASKGRWAEAYNVLTETNDFPEFTGRVCPALCEKACVLGLHFSPVTIRENEAAITERAYMDGAVVPEPPKHRTAKRVAVVGSGPAGLACANQLNRRGHNVTVFEKNEAIGGLLRFGIPDFKLGKNLVQRRVDIMKAEGVQFRTGIKIGEEKTLNDLQKEFDAVCVAIGAGVPRDLRAEGRELRGVHFALELLQMQNRINAGESIDPAQLITAKGKHVLVIGGGDTGSDCVGTSIRQGAASVTQIEIMPKPPVGYNPETPWPMYPRVLKTTSSHEEGCRREWCLSTKRFVGADGAVTGVEVEQVEWQVKDGRQVPVPTGKTELIEAELVLLAMGFVHPEHSGMVEQAGFELDARGNIAAHAAATSVDKVFAAGDAAQGASLVVRAIASGRAAAKAIDEYLRR